MTNILISVTTIFVITAFFGPADSYFESCISEKCSTMPWSNETKNFNDAKNWCKERNSSLAVVNDSNTQEALTTFLNSAQLNEKRKPSKQEMTWDLVNGSKYLGGIVEQNENDYWFYGYTKVHSNVFSADAFKPNSLRNSLCEFENTRCSNNSPNNYLYKGKCFVKFENENLTWYKARESRHSQDRSQDFVFGVYSSLSTPTSNRVKRLRAFSERKYFNGTELKRTASWSSFATTSNTVLLHFANVTSSPRTSAVNNVVTTASVKTTSSWSSSATTSSTVSLPFADVTSSPRTSAVNNALIVGLVLGIAVILPLLIIILILVIIILHQKRSRERTQNNDGSVTQVEAAIAAPAANYQHLNRQTMFGPGSEMPHYD